MLQWYKGDPIVISYYNSDYLTVLAHLFIFKIQINYKLLHVWKTLVLDLLKKTDILKVDEICLL